jgi:hypothetical protein
MLVHTCNPSTQRQRQEDLEFQAGLDYIVRRYLNQKKKKKSYVNSTSAVC